MSQETGEIVDRSFTSTPEDYQINAETVLDEVRAEIGLCVWAVYVLSEEFTEAMAEDDFSRYAREYYLSLN